MISRPRAGAVAQRRRLGQRAAERRRAGGVLAVGRASGTREELLLARTLVFARADGRCELCSLLPTYDGHPPTDFAHVRARSQGGEDSRFNALATCHASNLAMQGAFAKGRWLVTPITLKGVRGFDAELVKAAGKFSYRLGDSVTLAAGFIRAEPEIA